MIHETTYTLQARVVLKLFDKGFKKPFQDMTLDTVLEVEELLNGTQKVVLRDGRTVGVRFHFKMEDPDDGPH